MYHTQSILFSFSNKKTLQNYCGSLELTLHKNRTFGSDFEMAQYSEQAFKKHGYFLAKVLSTTWTLHIYKIKYIKTV